MRERTEPTIPCPACGFLVLVEAYGSYDICPLCGWEDDIVQLVNPTSGGGANKTSLLECQQEALLKYPVVIRKAAGYTRSEEWRPLTADEVETAELARKREHWHTSATNDPGEVYWKRTQ